MAADDETPFHEEEPEPNAGGDNPNYWDSDEALENLKMEKSLHPDESNRALTQRLFEENAPQAAMTLIHLAQHATNENTRLNAAKYVTERVLGKIGDADSEEAMPLEKLLGEMHAEIERHANGGR